jgi:hypothetical protein
MMAETKNTLTVDEAVAEFMKAARERLDTLPPPAEAHASPPRTFEEAEASRFNFAEKLLRQMCPHPETCSNRRCRRDRLCRHIVDLRAMQLGPVREPLSRRSLGARAVRHAIWLYVNARQQA